jgi:hypothetical protein
VPALTGRPIRRDCRSARASSRLPAAQPETEPEWRSAGVPSWPWGATDTLACFAGGLAPGEGETARAAPSPAIMPTTPPLCQLEEIRLRRGRVDAAPMTLPPHRLRIPMRCAATAGGPDHRSGDRAAALPQCRDPSLPASGRSAAPGRHRPWQPAGRWARRRSRRPSHMVRCTAPGRASPADVSLLPLQYEYRPADQWRVRA